VSAETPATERYVVNFDNPDCGVGHAIGYLNGQLKVARRNTLELAYSSAQLKKSTDRSLLFRAKRLVKRLILRRHIESHNLGDDLDALFAPGARTASRDRLFSPAHRGRYRFLTLPATNIPLDWREHDDDEAYGEIDRFIRAHPEPFTVFVLPKNWQPDCEFSATRRWFQNAYASARRENPIACGYWPDCMNIAIHVRRGDILPGRSFESLSNRLLPDAWYIARLSELCAAIRGPKHIHVISEGNDARYVDENGLPSTAFERLGDALATPVTMRVARPFLDDFHHLVCADVLIGSRSGMSHLAAVLSDGLKIAPRMWHSYRGVDHVMECDPGQPKPIADRIDAALTRYLASRRRAAAPRTTSYAQGQRASTWR